MRLNSLTTLPLVVALALITSLAQRALAQEPQTSKSSSHKTSVYTPPRAPKAPQGDLFALRVGLGVQQGRSTEEFKTTVNHSTDEQPVSSEHMDALLQLEVAVKPSPRLHFWAGASLQPSLTLEATEIVKDSTRRRSRLITSYERNGWAIQYGLEGVIAQGESLEFLMRGGIDTTQLKTLNPRDGEHTKFLHSTIAGFGVTYRSAYAQSVFLSLKFAGGEFIDETLLNWRIELL